MDHGTATIPRTTHYVRAAAVAEVRAAGCLPVQVGGHTLALFAVDDQIYALDNRCPHMGFPLHRGTVKDGILTCHWHHARFDMESGGTFDEWADDVRAFPIEIREGHVWVDMTPAADTRGHHRLRLTDGLERNIPLVLGKAVIALLDEDEDLVEPFRVGLEFGARCREAGWGTGLTIHTCMMNLLPSLEPEERSRALYHGLSAVARECAGAPQRFGLRPLPALTASFQQLKQWFRQFVEVRDAEGAERCIVSAIRAGADHRQMADMLLSAATDHRYINIGHVADFTNKALEALDVAGWEYAEGALTSLVSDYASADRMEESNAWRYPVDLIAILERAFEQLPDAMATGRIRRGSWSGRKALVTIVLSEDPQHISESLLTALREGATGDELASAVTYAAVLRVAQFHTSNEFGDWDTAHHSFTFANAIHQGLRRTPSPELLRGVFDAARTVYLNRFLNVPPAHLPEPSGRVEDPEGLLQEMPALLDRQQRVGEAAGLVSRYLYGGGRPERLLAVLGRLLLREDRDFHSIQAIEAAFRQYRSMAGTSAGIPVLVAAARYLAAHAPTMRAQGQTFQIARRLSRGEELFEES